ncbi:carboxy-S-adenosyl-L-methionine synthase CmoA [Porticoccaceae bacterium]|jgi:tRNA (cmo5U34)-methyltransferase|nr:carboxy-S-adenosyl-L-methionine synthase CmoA [Porticoccaceae bacterium]MDB3966393.1 carboxy-S-adenosyl-L-methionine synthase CmoA [Porticoccaceae bacterium]
MTDSHRDNLFASPLGNVPGFVFDQAVVDVFPDMISRSVPGYETILAHTGELAHRYIQPQTNCYDLGCSLGASTLAMGQRIEGRGAKIIAVDNSPAMLTKCSSILAASQCRTEIELVNGNICDIQISNASLVVMNFTLQFVPLEQRPNLLEKIYQGLNPGGCLIISEKLSFEPESLNTLLSDLHHDFKRAQGYSDLEISQKRDSIENVLVPETLETHIQRLRACGFQSASPWFQCFNFCSLVAIK